jgi:CelD/BcsL family acetyltransferase involved in cellulose biosynthesis
VIAAPGAEAGACAAFSVELARRRGEWDVLRLACLAPNSVAATALPRTLMRVGFAPRLDEVDVCPYICLERAWGAYSADRNPSIQKAERRDSRRLEKKGTVRIEWLAPGTGHAADREKFVNRIVHISGRSWKARSGNALDSAGPRAFIRRLSELAHRRGWLSIWLLTLDHEPVAMEYHLVVSGCVYALRSDFDEAFRRVSPGSYLRRHLLERVFALGLDRYYFGMGLNAHKGRWTDQVETVDQLTVYAHSWMGVCLAVWERALKPLARMVARRGGPRRFYSGSRRPLAGRSRRRCWRGQMK